MNTILGIVHGLDYLLCSWLLGMFIFHAGIASAAGETVSSCFNRSRKLSVVLTSTIFLVSLIWFILVAVEMAESWNSSVLFSVATSTHFGHIGLCKIGLILVILTIALIKKLSQFWWITLILPLCFSLSGHASTVQTGTAINLILDYIHLVAVSIWTGGLMTLLFWLKTRLHSTPNSLPANASILVVTRFSHFAMASTALIGVTGLAMALRYGVDFASLVSTEYGKLVLTKFGLFILTLSVASINPFIHMKRWRPDREMEFARNVARTVLVELVMVSCIFIVAGFLTRLSP
ncbi:MAG: CopD family protein [Bdellovibrio sp.]|nr:CopD family protein [Bdellovibrio sp.]